MLRVLVVALAVLTLATSTISLSAPRPRPLTPGITLIGKGLVSGSALDKSGLTGIFVRRARLPIVFLRLSLVVLDLT